MTAKLGTVGSICAIADADLSEALKLLQIQLTMGVGPPGLSVSIPQPSTAGDDEMVGGLWRYTVLKLAPGMWAARSKSIKLDASRRVGGIQGSARVLE